MFSVSDCRFPPYSVALLKHTITQSRAIIRSGEKQREREMESDREEAHSEECSTEQMSAFTRAVITATHSVHLTSPLAVLSSRSVIHRVLAPSSRFVRVAEITGFTKENNVVEPQQFQGKHHCDVTITESYFYMLESGKMCSNAVAAGMRYYRMNYKRETRQ